MEVQYPMLKLRLQLGISLLITQKWSSVPCIWLLNVGIRTLLSWYAIPFSTVVKYLFYNQQQITTAEDLVEDNLSTKLNRFACFQILCSGNPPTNQSQAWLAQISSYIYLNLCWSTRILVEYVLILCWISVLEMWSKWSMIIALLELAHKCKLTANIVLLIFSKSWKSQMGTLGFSKFTESPLACSCLYTVDLACCEVVAVDHAVTAVTAPKRIQLRYIVNWTVVCCWSCCNSSHHTHADSA